MQFGKISDLLGFTRTELSVITFLLGVFLFGLGVNYFSPGKLAVNNFDYSKVDSLFLSSGSSDEEEAAILKPELKKDYRQEVLDLKAETKYVKKATPKESSIDLNKASVNELINLPGIGEKTAEKIIKFREENGGFKNVEDLLEVKGIGPAKLNKIKKYVFIK